MMTSFDRISLCVFAGPVTGVVCSVFGCRTSVMTGAVLVTAGFLMSSFCDNLTSLLLAFGISIGKGGSQDSTVVVSVSIG